MLALLYNCHITLNYAGHFVYSPLNSYFIYIGYWTLNIYYYFQTSFPDGDPNGVIDFIIINALGKCHEARIRREHGRGQLVHHLYVKGFMILEHASASKSLQSQSSTEEVSIPPPIMDYMEPDTLIGAVGNGIDQRDCLPPPPYYNEPLFSDKKNN